MTLTRRWQFVLTACVFLVAIPAFSQDQPESYKLELTNGELVGFGNNGRSLFVIDSANQQLLEINRDTQTTKPFVGKLEIDAFAFDQPSMFSANRKYLFFRHDVRGTPIPATCLNTETGQPIFQIDDFRPGNEIDSKDHTDYRFSPDSKLLVVPRQPLDGGYRLAVWNLESGEWDRSLSGGWPYSIHPESKAIATTEFAEISLQDQRILPYLELVDMDSRKTKWTSEHVLTLPEDGRWVRPQLTTVFSPDGQSIAVASNSLTISYPNHTGVLPSQLNLVDFQTGKVTRRIDLKDFPLALVAPQVHFASNGKSILVKAGSTTFDGNVALVDISADPPRIIHSGVVATMSHDSKKVCLVEDVGSKHFVARIISLNDYSVVAEFDLPEVGNILGMTLSRTDQHLALWCLNPGASQKWNWKAHVIGFAKDHPTSVRSIALDEYDIAETGFLPDDELAIGWESDATYVIEIFKFKE